MTSIKSLTTDTISNWVTSTGTSSLPVAAVTGSIPSILSMSSDQAEALAGPFFGASLLPYLVFLYFIQQSPTVPKGVFVGFVTLLLFVFLTIPAAIAAKILYGVSLADCDWLHGSAESLLTITNLVTVVAFRQALQANEYPDTRRNGENTSTQTPADSPPTTPMPKSVTSYAPMAALSAGMIAVATATVIVPALNEPSVHTPYLGGFLDLPHQLSFSNEPDNALTIATWIIHVSSLVEFLVAMGFCWRWAGVVQNERWKGLTWGLLPLHTSGITACTYHLFYNQISILVPLQALLTCLGNTTAAVAAYRLAVSEGWTVSKLPFMSSWLETSNGAKDDAERKDVGSVALENMPKSEDENNSFLIGFEDLGDALAQDNDLSFLGKLFVGCALASYLIKYGESWIGFEQQTDNTWLALSFIFVPSLLNAYKWYRRGLDNSFDGWF